MSNLLLMPQYILTGKGALKDSIEHIAKCGEKALIVTDETMVKIGTVEKLTKELDAAGVEYSIFDGINGEPTDTMIEEGKKVYLDTKSDFLIGIGGGSPIDSMKAIGAMVTNPGKIADYNGKPIPNEPPKMAAIATTAGTGSEATKFTIISDTVNDIKMLLSGPYLVPDIAVVDPELSATVPPAVTVATGVDALTHAIEAFASRKEQPITNTLAMSAIKRIFNNLETVYKDGSNLDARNEMAIGSLEAGIAFSNASVTIVHGMSRPIGALFHVPHGLSNAMLLEDCLGFMRSGAVEDYALMAKELHLVSPDEDVEKASHVFVEKTMELLAKLDIQTLKEFGVDEEEFMKNIDKMAKDALDSGSPANTKRTPTKEDIIDIYKKLW